MKTLLSNLLFIAFLITIPLGAQVYTVSDFEDLTLPTMSYWNGSSSPLGTNFSSDFAIYPNYYDTAWGGYWSSGWAYSNMTDSSTSGFSNMYAVKALTGYNGTRNYGVGQNGSIIHLDSIAIGQSVEGIYVCNGTYAFNSMRDGDNIAKKFGGLTGNDPDWFKLSISGWYNGNPVNDTIDFMLADFTFSDSTQDYIVDDWTFVHLGIMGAIDSLKFELSSSDVGAYGMNTPAFFCIDNFMMKGALTETDDITTRNNISLFPNPASDYVQLTHSEEYTIEAYRIFNSKGQLIEFIEKPLKHQRININDLPKGLYTLHLETNKGYETKSFIKN